MLNQCLGQGVQESFGGRCKWGFGAGCRRIAVGRCTGRCFGAGCKGELSGEGVKQGLGQGVQGELWGKL